MTRENRERDGEWEERAGYKKVFSQKILWFVVRPIVREGEKKKGKQGEREWGGGAGRKGGRERVYLMTKFLKFHFGTTDKFQFVLDETFLYFVHRRLQRGTLRKKN